LAKNKALNTETKPNIQAATEIVAFSVQLFIFIGRS
jgi:hypothetical protein